MQAPFGLIWLRKNVEADARGKVLTPGEDLTLQLDNDGDQLVQVDVHIGVGEVFEEGSDYLCDLFFEQVQGNLGQEEAPAVLLSAGPIIGACEDEALLRRKGVAAGTVGGTKGGVGKGELGEEFPKRSSQGQRVEGYCSPFGLVAGPKEAGADLGRALEAVGAVE
jgi:hypothetical protein